MATKHGMINTKVYRAWISMKQRCFDSSRKTYKYYGGRGVTVCSEWVNDFQKFYLDMGDPPTKLHSLDRVDGDKNYCKDNCKWATKSEQCFNRKPWESDRKASSGYRGVYAVPTGFIARVKDINLGRFKTKEDAARAYNQKSVELYGANAILNIVTKEEQC